MLWLINSCQMNNALIITSDDKGLRGQLISSTGVKEVRVDLDPHTDPKMRFLVGCTDILDELVKPQYYNGITVCIASNVKNFTVGTVYEWKDGRTEDDLGTMMPSHKPLESLDEITNLGLKFTELKWGKS